MSSWNRSIQHTEHATNQKGHNTCEKSKNVHNPCFAAPSKQSTRHNLGNVTRTTNPNSQCAPVHRSKILYPCEEIVAFQVVQCIQNTVGFFCGSLLCFPCCLVAGIALKRTQLNSSSTNAIPVCASVCVRHSSWNMSVFHTHQPIQFQNGFVFSFSVSLLVMGRGECQSIHKCTMGCSCYLLLPSPILCSVCARDAANTCPHTHTNVSAKPCCHLGVSISCPNMRKETDPRLSVCIDMKKGARKRQSQRWLHPPCGVHSMHPPDTRPRGIYEQDTIENGYAF